MGPIVETRQGRLRGESRDGVLAFRGIPYARPPVGPRRWRAPEPPEPWAGVRDATRFGAAAPQVASPLSTLLGVEEAFAEDCLFLNVWTPSLEGGGRPVLVWIHGGSFRMGSGSWPVYDGSRLAREGDAVVVTFNYRLGALGFLGLPESDGGELPGLGNWGLLDQIAALEWVRDHAAAFGGDPRRVTAFGESAGAMSLGTLLTLPRARGLADRAILQSGAAHNAHDAADGARVTAAFLEEVGLERADLARLRDLPVDAVLAAQTRVTARLARELPGLVFQPLVDGRVVPRAPIDAWRSGDAADLPILVGTNLDEWKLFGLADPKARLLDDEGLLRRMRRGLPGEDAAGRPRAEAVVETYRMARAGRASTEPAELWFAIQSDRWFRHPAMSLAENHACRGREAWAYLFTWPSPALGGVLGACHALEIPFVFGGVEDERAARFAGSGSATRELSRRMREAWLAFARGGPPESEGLAWPRYDAGARETMRLGETCESERAPLELERAFWDRVQ